MGCVLEVGEFVLLVNSACLFLFVCVLAVLQGYGVMDAGLCTARLNVCL